MDTLPSSPRDTGRRVERPSGMRDRLIRRGHRPVDARGGMTTGEVGDLLCALSGRAFDVTWTEPD